jgi:hypothetical protein
MFLGTVTILPGELALIAVTAFWGQMPESTIELPSTLAT